MSYKRVRKGASLTTSPPSWQATSNAYPTLADCCCAWQEPGMAGRCPQGNAPNMAPQAVAGMQTATSCLSSHPDVPTDRELSQCQGQGRCELNRRSAPRPLLHAISPRDLVGLLRPLKIQTNGDFVLRREATAETPLAWTSIVGRNQVPRMMHATRTTAANRTCRQRRWRRLWTSALATQGWPRTTRKHQW